MGLLLLIQTISRMPNTIPITTAAWYHTYGSFYTPVFRANRILAKCACYPRHFCLRPSVRPPARQPARIRSAPTGRISVKSGMWFFGKAVEKSQIWVKLDKRSCILHRPKYTFLPTIWNSHKRTADRHAAQQCKKGRSVVSIVDSDMQFNSFNNIIIQSNLLKQLY